jgi:hypothetical protein
MTNFKEQLKPMADKYKFWYFINDMDDDEIIDFLIEEVFGTKDFKNITFEQAKEKCNSVCSLDSIIEKDDQKKLFDILQQFA